MTTIERIRAEIERQMKFYDEKEMRAWKDPEQGDEDALWYQGHRKMCAKLLSFLDTLEEPDKCKGCNNVKGCIACVDGDQWAHYEEPVSEELEDELERFIASGKSVTVDDYGIYKVSYHDFKKIARHFAEWGKEQGYREGFLEGAKIQREEDNQLVDIIYQQGIEKGKDEIRETLKKEEENERNTTSGI